MIDISKQVLSKMLSTISSVIEDLEEPPEDLALYDKKISWVQEEMSQYYELDLFRLALAYLIRHPEIPLTDFTSTHFYTNAKDEPIVLRAMLVHTYEKIWGLELPSDEELVQVRLFDMHYHQWRHLGNVRRQKKVSKGAVAFWITGLAANLGVSDWYATLFADQATSLMQQYKEWICMKYGFAYLLRNPQLLLQPFVAPEFFASEEELRQAVRDFYQKVWGELPPVEDMEGVELVDTKLSLWRHWWIHSKDWSPTVNKID